MAAAAEGHSAAALAGLFGRAAQYLSGSLGVSPPDDVAALLRTLEYDSEPGGPEAVANRVALLRAAARFSRVFQLSAPEAPGLVFLGAEVDPSMVASGHARTPLHGVGGMGLSMRAAFESCIGEGVELLSQFEADDEPLVASSAGEMLDAARGKGRGFLESLLAGSEEDARFDCLVATGLTSDTTMLVPAEICLRRLPARSRMTAPFLLSTGCAAGRSKTDAVLHGLCELVERDAAGLWWRGGMHGRPLALEDPALGEAAALLAGLRQGNQSRRTWLLDITTDLGIPATAAISGHADGKGLRLRSGRAPDVGRRGSRRDHGALSVRARTYAVVAAKRAEGGEEKLNDRDRDHLARATQIDADTCSLLHPRGMPARHEASPSESPAEQIRWLTARLAAQGFEAFLVDLTRPAFAVPVVRVVAPGLQVEPSQLESARLQAAIAATGGGHQATNRGALVLAWPRAPAHKASRLPTR